MGARNYFKMISVNPEYRFKTMAEVASAIEMNIPLHSFLFPCD